MSAAVRWLSLVKCLYSAGSRRTSVSAGGAGAAARRQPMGAPSAVPCLAGMSTDPAMSQQSPQAPAEEWWGKHWCVGLNASGRPAVGAGGVKS